MAKKWGKYLLGIAAVGTAVAGAIYLSKEKHKENFEDEFSDDFEDEDFDLDNDMNDVSNREYVSLTPSASDTEEGDVTSDAVTPEEPSEKSDSAE